MLWNSAQCYVAAWMRGKFGGKWIHTYAWLDLFTVHLNLSQHCLLINYTPIQNKKFFKKMTVVQSQYVSEKVCYAAQASGYKFQEKIPCHPNNGEGNGNPLQYSCLESVLAWRIPGMGEPGGLPSLGSHRVGHD